MNHRTKSISEISYNPPIKQGTLNATSSKNIRQGLPARLATRTLESNNMGQVDKIFITRGGRYKKAAKLWIKKCTSTLLRTLISTGISEVPNYNPYVRIKFPKHLTWTFDTCKFQIKNARTLRATILTEYTSHLKLKVNINGKFFSANCLHFYSWSRKWVANTWQ